LKSIYEFFLERYHSFTEIQKLAIPAVERRENCLIVAPTGAGKTEAAVLPLINSVAGAEAAPIGILYITPLRALNRDMLLRLEELCAHAGVSVGVRHGDTTQKERNRQARSAPLLLITTPETLQSILPTKHIGRYLRNLSAVVVDELHELYYSKRGAQLSLALERLEQLSPGFQRIGISATIGDANTAARFLCGDRKCTVVKSGGLKEMALEVEQPSRGRHDLGAQMERFGLDSPALGRLGRISELVSHSKSAIIFANTRQVVESLGSKLVHLNSIDDFGGIGVHHSSLDKEERISLEKRFKSGSVRSIIATSSLELGIDIGNIDLVIQYGSPRQALRLAQRVGRSGHTHKGMARGVVISTSAVETLETISIFELVHSGSFETFRPQFGALDVLANQICGIALDKQSIELAELERVVRGSFVYAALDSEKLVWLLKFMTGLRLVGFDGKLITSGGRTRMYYYDHLSVIPDSKRFMVKNIVENRIISTLDDRFVASNVEEGSVFITKGLPWKVLSIDDDIISVEPSTDLDAAVPDWTGEDIPVSHDTVRGVFRLLNSPGSIGRQNADSLRAVDELAARQAHSFLPSENAFFVESLEEYCVLYTGLGTQANEAFSRLLAHMISARLGRSVNTRSSPYMIMLELGRDFDIVRLLKGIESKSVEKSLRDSVAETELFRYRFITIAKLFGVIDRDAAVSRSFAKRIIKVMKDSPIHDEALRELLESYFDIATLKQFIEELESGAVKIRLVSSDTPSVFTRAILASAHYTRELVMPLTPNSELVESFSKFIFSKSVKMLCTYCGFFFERRLNEIKEMELLVCPNCSSPMISIYSDEYKAVVDKKVSGKRLTRKETGVLKEALQYAGLISSYGAKATVALSVYGVGPKSAARILMMRKHDEHSFFMDLLEAQKNFIRTKKYWSI
jgi:ATP-dependent Lhr-like helicase